MEFMNVMKWESSLSLHSGLKQNLINILPYNGGLNSILGIAMCFFTKYPPRILFFLYYFRILKRRRLLCYLRCEKSALHFVESACSDLPGKLKKEVLVYCLILPFSLICKTKFWIYTKGWVLVILFFFFSLSDPEKTTFRLNHSLFSP